MSLLFCLLQIIEKKAYNTAAMKFSGNIIVAFTYQHFPATVYYKHNMKDDIF